MAIADRVTYARTAVPTREAGLPADEARLIEHARSGDQIAFEALVQRYERRIHAYTYQMLGNSEDVFDVTQETFIRAYKNLPRTSEDLKFSAWLHRIATNACLDLLRRRRHVRWLSWDIERHEHFLEYSPFDDPERVALDGEHRMDVQRVLAAMQPRYRTALLLREFEGLTGREIGAAMGISVPAVKSILFRARDEFRQLHEQLTGG
jgi:RNA polymerase sigma-70 factor (ECF subfamily)